MAGHEERELRRLKRALKRNTARKNRARVRESLHDADYEAAAEDAAVPDREQSAGIHVGRNKPRGSGEAGANDVLEPGAARQAKEKRERDSP